MVIHDVPSDLPTPSQEPVESPKIAITPGGPPEIPPRPAEFDESEIMNDLESQNVPDFGEDLIKPGTKARCTYAFEKRSADELSMKPDDIVVLIKVSSNGWWKGEIGGMLGW